ncbi:hypothetical protein DFJ63DRAFT_335166 [Scheffersomyces coipomensis]|uniref:uncharacterized protein n=1 Tax=Scheffersomyces coipomensis TaxID=1788519 RepID=UPI00315DF7DC
MILQANGPSTSTTILNLKYEILCKIYTTKIDQIQVVEDQLPYIQIDQDQLDQIERENIQLGQRQLAINGFDIIINQELVFEIIDQINEVKSMRVPIIHDEEITINTPNFIIVPTENPLFIFESCHKYLKRFIIAYMAINEVEEGDKVKVELGKYLKTGSRPSSIIYIASCLDPENAINALAFTLRVPLITSISSRNTRFSTVNKFSL